MKKHRITKIQEVSGASEQEITPEAVKQARLAIVDLLMPVVEKVQNLPPVPVKESYSELLSQLDSPKRAPVIVNHADGRRIRYDLGNAEIISEGITSDVTLGITSESTLGITPDVTLGITSGVTFTDSEKLILEQLTLEQFKNGEH